MARPPLEAARHKWRVSGLTDEQAGLLHLRGLEGSETRALHDSFHGVDACHIPYFDFDGRPTGFYRVRYLAPLPGWAGQAEKPQRYAQPPGSINQIYLPPLLEQPWSAVRDDPRVLICITEGEFKAAAGCAVGLAMIGLGGVDVWRSAKRLLPVLPQIAEIDWKDREVAVIFDSDSATKPAVSEAQRRLARELLERGAKPSLVQLPPADDGSKQGVDDFLVAHGGDALMDLIKASLVFPEADALHALNEEVVLVRNPGIVIEVATGHMMDARKFVAVHYANRKYSTIDSKGKLVQKGLAQRWLEWEHRHEANKIVYAPGQEQEENREWNIWKGWGCEPEAGDISPWTTLLDYLFRGEPELRVWFERWCAWPLQHPGAKMYSAVVLWSAQTGTGKTLLAYTLKRIYGSNFSEAKSRDLQADFNSWQMFKSFIYGDEINSSDSHRMADHLKGLITQEEIRIAEKFLPAFTIRDCINYLLASNHPDCVKVETFDRRYAIKEVVGAPLPRAFYLNTYDPWLKGDGPSHLFHHLLNLPMGDFHPLAPAPASRSKTDMSHVSMSDIGRWVADLYADPDHVLACLGEVGAKSDLFTTHQLFRAYDPDGRKVTVNGMARALGAQGHRAICGGQPLRLAIGNQRLYAVRNEARWLRATRQAAMGHFNDHNPPLPTKKF